MLHSSFATRIVAVLIGLIVTPVALGLLSVGGTSWLAHTVQGFGYDVSPLRTLSTLAVPTLSMFAGAVLLLLVVATGFWTSLGLLATAIPAIFPTLVALAPGLYLVMRPVFQVLPFGWTESLLRGVAAPVFWTLFGMGVVLLWQRARPARHAALSAVLGAILAPILMLLSALLLIDGLQRGLVSALQTYDLDFNILAFVEVTLAGLLMLASVLATRWSPFALVLPALLLALLTVVAIVPVLGHALFGMLPSEIAPLVMVPLYMGGAGALAVIMLAFTGVIVAVRRRMRLLQGIPAPAWSAA